MHCFTFNVSKNYEKNSPSGNFAKKQLHRKCNGWDVSFNKPEKQFYTRLHMGKQSKALNLFLNSETLQPSLKS